jgi:hypothetical protein
MRVANSGNKMRTPEKGSPTKARPETASAKKHLIAVQEFQYQPKSVIPLSQSNSEKKAVGSPGRR